MKPSTSFAIAAFVAAIAPSAHALAVPSEAELVQMLKVVDDRQQNTGDYRSTAYLEQKERGKEDTAFEVAFYRRDADDKLMILFLKPKAEAGKGYLRLDKNLFMYDPTVGKWERRTERERIGGTDSRRADFDESRLAEEYVTKWVNEEALGKRVCNHFKLEAKAGVDVAYPVIELWVDKETGNVMKRLEFALSGKLMRRALYPEWEKLWSESKKADVYFPKKIFIFDEVEKGNSTQVVIQKVDLNPLDENIFTKAWLESKSR